MESSAYTGDAHALARLQQTARDTSGWLKFLGILNMVVSAPAVIVLVGLLGVWMGWLLYKAGDAAGKATGQDLVEMMEKLRTYFIVNAILAILGVVVIVIYIVIIVVVGISMFQDSGIEI
ncbi:MAG: DUF5362 family protein [Rhodothermales bacterium]|nr:DUF5362 family protein [Rhodothermales bacterium]